MCMHTPCVARLLAAAALTAILPSCTEPPLTAPEASLDVVASGFEVVPLLLRPDEGSESTARGELTVFIGTLHPPNPCLSSVQFATVVVCGVIHNPDGEPLGGASLIVQLGRGEPVELEFALPPNPCLTYRVQAAAAADLGTETPTLPAVQAVFSFEGGPIVSVEGTPGPPNIRTTAGSPDVPPSPCVIGFASRVG